MTVAEAAAKYHVSKQAIYQQLNKLRGTGKNSKTGQITQEGMLLLESIYQEKEQAVKQVESTALTLAQAQLEQLKAEHAQTIEGLQAKIKQLADALSAAEKERDAEKQAAEVQQLRLEAATDKANRLDSEVQFLREQLSKVLTPKLGAGDQDATKKQPNILRRLFRLS